MFIFYFTDCDPNTFKDGVILSNSVCMRCGRYRAHHISFYISSAHLAKPGDIHVYVVVINIKYI